jgi:vesicle coat complex subunit
MAVVKLYFNNRQLVLSEGLLDGLKALMVDSNPTVSIIHCLTREIPSYCDD